MTLKNAFDEFMFQKELAGLSPASLSDYRNYITIMLNHVGESMDLESVTYELVAGYIMVLLHRPLSKATISTYVRMLEYSLDGCMLSMVLALTR